MEKKKIKLSSEQAESLDGYIQGTLESSDCPFDKSLLTSIQRKIREPVPSPYIELTKDETLELKWLLEDAIRIFRFEEVDLRESLKPFQELLKQLNKEKEI
ncbi:MAG: hypothetical protein AOA66_1073 [Candidatus Bathyarchaeota archaeon BA2]|nr:MAG: hypothetical protein AOA66_1073 [Candidatus Bathyarchaeota archaeon BA2]